MSNAKLMQIQTQGMKKNHLLAFAFALAFSRCEPSEMLGFDAYLILLPVHDRCNLVQFQQSQLQGSKTRTQRTETKIMMTSY